jgi:hypothetical protein
MAKGDAGRLHLRLFVEGIEVPVLGAVVNIGIGAPSSCTLQIVPTDRGLEFLPRTLVHLFYYDFAADSLGHFSEETEDTEASFFKRYKLLFCGEMIQTQEVKAASGRQLVLQCLDLSSYWDTAYQYMLTFGPSGNVYFGTPAKFIGANDYLFDDIINDPVSVTSNLMSRGKPRTPGLETAKGTVGGIIRLLEAVGGVWWTADKQLKARGINDFFTLAELRLKLLQQIGADEGDTAARIFSAEVFSQWLHGSLGGGGGLMSFRDILRIVGQYTYYEFVPNPAARLSPEYDKPLEWTTTHFVGRRGDGLDIRLFNETRRVKGLVAGSVAQLLVRDASVRESTEWRSGGAGNYLDDVFLTAARTTAPSESTDQRMQVLNEEEVAAGAKPVYMNVQGPLRSAIAGLDDLRYMCNQLIDDADPAVLGHYQAALGYYEAALSAADQFEASGELMSMAESITITTITDSLTSAEESLIAAQGTTSTQHHSDTVTVSSRLYTQILRPDAWMSAPPRCNVWFPDLYTNYNYQRQHLREVTRLQLCTPMEIIGFDPLLNSYYYAPVVEAVRGRDKAALGSDSDVNKYLLMDHEIFSGIVPKFSRQSEIHFYGNKAQRGVVASRGKSLRAVYGQRAAHFDFFKYRYAARAATISGPFNPSAVCGFPSLILRKGLTLPGEFDLSELLDLVNSGVTEVTLGETAEGLPITLPTHLVGQTTSLTHSINQSGGHTSANLNYVRSHRTRQGDDDEFLKLAREEPTERYFTSFLDAKEAVQNRDQGTIKLVASVTPQEGEAEDMDLTWRAMVSEGPLGGEVTAVETSTDVVIYVNPDEETSQRLYTWIKITEKFKEGDGTPAGVREPTKPWEEMVRPSWFSEVYTNSRTQKDGSRGGIGPEVYEKLFGIGSIVDYQDAGAVGSDVLVSELPHDYMEQAGSTGDSTLSGASPTAADVLETLKGSHITAEETVSIAKAADYLAVVYGTLAREGNDIQKFVRGYTWRPIATMEEILGSPDLEFDEAGNVTQGTEGFHSRAFGPYEECAILLGDDEKEEEFTRLEGSEKKSVDLTADPRRERWLRVRAYIEELRLGRGLRG